MKKLVLFSTICLFSLKLVSQGQPLMVFTTGGNSSVCAGSCTTIGCQAIGGTQPYTYSWNPGGATTNTVTVCPTVSTTYTITVSDQAGSISSSSAVVTVNPAPTITSSPQTISCGQSSAMLTASGGTSYTWSTGALTPSITVSPTVTTTYTVTGTNAQGCTNSITTQVTVTGCGLNVAAPSVALCRGICASLTATGSGGTIPYTYTWNPGGFVGNPFNVCPSNTTTYTVVVTDGSGQTASTTAVVTINPNPTITSSPQTVCAGSCTSLTAGGGANYTWTPNIGSGAGPHNVCPAITTTYSVVGATAGGCTASTTVVVTVQVCSGIKNISYDKELRILTENISTGKIRILYTSSQAEVFTLNVSDVLGRTILTREFSKQAGTFDELISMGEKGYSNILIITIRSGNSVLSEKTILDR